MVKKRFKYNYGEYHDQCTIADDVEREYIPVYSQKIVDMLNRYDEQYNLMKEKLENLGFQLIYIYEDYNMTDKNFEKKYTTNPGLNDNGEWMIITTEEYNRLNQKIK